MQLLKWLSVTDRFYKIYLDKQLAPYGINNSQYMFLIKICRSPGILQDSLLNIFAEAAAYQLVIIFVIRPTGYDM